MPKFQMLRRALLLTATLGALTLSGCATRDIPASYQFSPASGRGVVLASLTFNGAEYGAMSYRLRHLGTRQVTVLPVAQSDPQKPDNIPAGKWTPEPGFALHGRLAAVELPAGEYQVEGWGMQVGTRILSSTKVLEETFKVTPGRPVYIGNLHTLFRGNGRYVTLRVDERQRDLALAAKHFPAIQVASLTYDIQLPAALRDAQGSGTGTSIDSLKDLLNNRAPTGGNLNDLPLKPAP